MTRLLCAFWVGFLAYAFLLPHTIFAMELNEGFGGVAYGSSCSKSFTGDDWKDAQIAPIWHDETRELRLTYDPDVVQTSEYSMRSKIHESLEYDGFSLINVLYMCEKATDRFAGIVATFSVLNTQSLDERIRAQFGEPDEVTALYSLWDRPEYFIQLNLNELIVYSKSASQ